ncbi:cation transporter [Marmoricola endophyticus]|uniref:Cation transporter n=1 Tax=Marmoricola endophyticus TaxID=2040280 RepID=A0A917F335_9ACTN|nr:cation diffusion facilitator family transporter [Marmoricola endophyticus]GGF48024.1 cation transporter [Marmoricola endophyticus]
MGHGHGHGTGHAAGRAEDRRRLWLVAGITALVFVVEVVGALLSGSLALLADAGHMLTDVGGVLLALFASYVATRPANDQRTFGYHRAEILAALVNALLLVVVFVYVAYEGVSRLLDPPPVQSGLMLVFAVVGLAANAVSLAVLTARRGESLNMRGAFLEVLGDTLGSVAAIVAGVVILATGFERADPIASLLIAVLIVPRALSLLREATSVLFESAPPGLDVAEVREHLIAMDGVEDVHDLHAWTITSGMPSLSAHVTVSDACLRERGVGPMLDDFARCVREDFGVEHATFQVEPASHQEHEDLGADHP